jgi:two-component system sensor histidine kinase UhpB
VDLPPVLAGDLFRIAQEAVVNSGRHANASAVDISLRRVGATVELGVADDGRGFNGREPLDGLEPGHIGLAGMRERAVLMHGELSIDSSERGTRVLVTVPAPQPGGSGS